MTVVFDDKKQDDRLQEYKLKEEEELAQILSRKYGVKYVDLTRIGIETDALQLLPEAESRAAEVAAFKKAGKKLLVAMRAPKRPDSLKALEKIARLGYTPEVYMVSHAGLAHAWERYSELSMATASVGGVLNLSNETIASMQAELQTINDVRIAIDTALQGTGTLHHVSRVLEILVAGALSLGASDIHIEPEDGYTHIRFRLDGVLTEAATVDTATFNLIRSRMKLLSGMKLNVTSAAQDGRFSIKVGEKEVEIRVSLIPGSYGESIVTRILDPGTISLSLESLGFDSYLMELFNHEINKPNGMILNTGPTGSGKTTTLYAFLKSVHTPDIKIITLENPVEYHLGGIVQTQITKDYSFAQGLRAILRQDPDIIMVGEIRDPEVAETAVNAALTGHLVFSTLHTNNAAGTFPRLIDLGVSAESIGASLTVSMAQRLVRKLCKFCKVESPLTPEAIAVMNRILPTIPHPESVPEQREHEWKAAGCDKCSHTGYKGRISVVEAILVSPEIESVMRNSPTEAEIWAAASKQNIRRMAEDGMVKVLQGVTDYAELARVVNMDEEMGRM